MSDSTQNAKLHSDVTSVTILIHPNIIIDHLMTFHSFMTFSDQ